MKEKQAALSIKRPNKVLFKNEKTHCLKTAISSFQSQVLGLLCIFEVLNDSSIQKALDKKLSAAKTL